MELKDLTVQIEALEKKAAEWTIRQESEMKTLGEATTKTGAGLEKAMAELADAKLELVELTKSHKTELDQARAEWEKRANDIETQIKRPGAGIGDEWKSIGQSFIESEGFKSRANAPQGQHQAQAELKNRSFMLERSAQIKAITGLSGSASGLVIPEYLLEIFRNPQRPPVLRELLNVSETAQGSVTYFTESGFYPCNTSLTSATSSGSADIEVASVDGMYAGQTLYIGSTAKVISSIATATLVVTLTETVGSIIASGTRVYSLTFANTAEGSLLPEMDITYTSTNGTTQAIGAFVKASNKILKNAPMLASEIDTRLAYAVQLNEERQVLWGSGTGTDLNGIMTASTGYNLNWSDLALGETQADLIRYGIRNALIANYAVSGLILHPTDKAALDLLKGSDGRYLNVTAGGRIWSVPILETTAMTSGRGLVGAFGLGARLFDGMATTIQTSDSDGDNFRRNMITIRGMEELFLAVYRPEAFCPLTFNAAPST